MYLSISVGSGALSNFNGWGYLAILDWHIDVYVHIFLLKNIGWPVNWQICNIAVTQYNTQHNTPYNTQYNTHTSAVHNTIAVVFAYVVCVLLMSYIMCFVCFLCVCLGFLLFYVFVCVLYLL